MCAAAEHTRALYRELFPFFNWRCFLSKVLRVLSRNVVNIIHDKLTYFSDSFLSPDGGSVGIHHTAAKCFQDTLARFFTISGREKSLPLLSQKRKYTIQIIPANSQLLLYFLYPGQATPTKSGIVPCFSQRC